MDFILRKDVKALISTHEPRELKAPPTSANAYRLEEAVDASRRAKVQISIEEPCLFLKSRCVQLSENLSIAR